MDEKRPRFRFGLLGLFALIAAVAVLVTLWNPLLQPSSRSNLKRVKIGMTEIKVAELVGKPDTVETYRGVIQTRYQLTAEDVWIVAYKDGLVYNSFPYRIADPVLRRPSIQPSSSPTLLNPETTNYRPTVD